MKIKRVTISSFRSIKKCSFYMNDVLAVVGENNSGKSAILRALNAFFNYEDERASFIDGMHQYSSGSIAKIELVFSGVNKAYFSQKLNSANELIVQCTIRKGANPPEYQYKKNGKYHDFDKAFINELNDAIQFVYIPPDRGNEYEKITGKSLLKRVLSSYLSLHTRKRDTLSPKVAEAKNYLYKNALLKISKEIEENYFHRRGFELTIDYPGDPDFGILIDDLDIFINEKSKKFPVDECGSGVQSLTNIALYSYLSKLQDSNIVLGIEEPELNLHPQSQKEFINEIKKGSSSSGLQALLTTHSTVIVDQLDHTDIIVLRKVIDAARGFRSDVFQLSEDFWSRHGIGQFQYNTFYKYKNSEFLFSKLVLVVESKTDAEVFRRLLLDFKIDIDEEGVSFLTIDGTGNLKYALYLLKEIKIPKLFFLDKDFFLDYSNGDKKSSRNPSGFFKYKKKLKNNPMINDLITSSVDRTNLQKLLTSNHSKANQLLEKYDAVSMSFNLEMDLINSSPARDEFYKILKVQPANQSSNTLLVNYSDAIKKPVTLLAVLANLQHKNLPNSYKRVKSLIKKRIEEIKG